MSTQAQIDANRQNAKHSTGPVTDSGKAASSGNRASHRLSPRTTFSVLPGESEDLYEMQLHLLEADYKPEDERERDLVRRMAEHDWMRQRAGRIMDGMIDCNPKYVDPFSPARYQPFALMMRYHSMHERSYYAAVNLFLKLRAEKTKGQIGFELQMRSAGHQEIQKERHRTAQKDRQLDADCKLFRLFRQSGDNPEALRLARDAQTRHQAA